MFPAGSNVYFLTSTILATLQSYILRHPKIINHINPNFYSDMKRVFETEKTPEDSVKYISKLKNIEDTSINAPAGERTVINNFEYEKSKMNYSNLLLKVKGIFSRKKLNINEDNSKNNKI